MNRQNAINLIRHLQNEGKSQTTINQALLLIKANHGHDLVDLFNRPKKTGINANPNRFNINTYGGGSARSFNQSKSLVKRELK